MNYNPKDIKDTKIREQVLKRALEIVPKDSWMYLSLYEEYIIISIVNLLKLEVGFHD